MRRLFIGLFLAAGIVAAFYSPLATVFFLLLAYLIYLSNTRRSSSYDSGSDSSWSDSGFDFGSTDCGSDGGSDCSSD